METRKLRTVLFGELDSTFTRLHLAVLQRKTELLLWVVSRSTTKAARAPFRSPGDFLHRARTRTAFEFQVAIALGGPFPTMRRPRCPVWVMENDKVVDLVCGLRPDLILSAGFRKILPSSLLEIPTIGAFNCHPSPLPRYAGSNPWFWILRNGETETGVTIHRMTADADAGPIVYQRRFPVPSRANHQDLYNRSSIISALGLDNCLDMWQRGSISEMQQNPDERTFFKAPKWDDHRIDWAQPANRVRDLVRASDPYPGAWTHIGSDQFIVRRVHVASCSQQDRKAAGTIQRIDKHGIWTSCGEEICCIESVLWRDRVMSGRQFAQSLSLSAGDRLK